mmetsp:Transcript_20164/g.33988  ORF Transcript_20164/g.33988 Transcript_20164/m.33988 type:complete len:339 (+) Transcript_20164:64-1080(+)
MAAPLSARSITDCDSLFEEMLKGGGMFSPMAGSLSGGTPYGFASTSGLNGSILANAAAAKERKGSFEDLMSPNGRRGDCPPPVGGLSRGNSRSGRAGGASGSNSPTSRAMGMMQPMLLEYERMLAQERIAKQQDTKSQQAGGAMGVEEIVPLQMLPYFRWLNNSAQRSLLKQLIERFQRTSYTPRYATIATPVHGMTTGLGDKNSNQDADLDPNCFDKIEGGGGSEGGVTSSGQKLKSNTESNARTSGGGGNDDEVAGGGVSGGGDASPGPSSRPLLRKGSSNTSMFDDAAIEAAVAVAMQLASHSSSAEQILQILTGNTDTSDGTNNSSSEQNTTND